MTIMKTLKKIFTISFLSIALLFSSCELSREVEPGTDTGILPERFKIDIPTSLSNEGVESGLKSATATESDTLNGNSIYRHLNSFIRIGEGAADIVQGIMFAIAFYDINEPMRLSYECEEDGRIKNLVVEEDVEYAGKRWEFMLTISDAESEGEPDGGKALQVFWNERPIEGIAILKPHHIDRHRNRLARHAMFRIGYSEAPSDKYERTMMVEISGLPIDEEGVEKGRPSFALRNMKMFVGKNGDRIDVYGNSDHPNARFFNDRAGFSWSFVASGFDSQDIGVAEVGLPPSILDENDGDVLLKRYSMKNVLTNEITEWFLKNWGIGPDSADLANYLQNTEAPGFFAQQGFVQAGVSPREAYDPLIRAINDLAPFNPKEVHEQTIEFK